MAVNAPTPHPSRPRAGRRVLAFTVTVVQHADGRVARVACDCGRFGVATCLHIWLASFLYIMMRRAGIRTPKGAITLRFERLFPSSHQSSVARG